MIDFRQTGRTTEMLKAAIEKKKSGSPVLIVMATIGDRDYMMNLAHFIEPGVLTTKDFISLSQVSRPGVLRGRNSGGVFVDHFVWEYGDLAQLRSLNRQLSYLNY